MKTNVFLSFIIRCVLLILFCLYFVLVFGSTNSKQHFGRDHSASASTFVQTPAIPKLLSFEGFFENKQVKLTWKFETVEGLDECILERADKPGDFRPVAYFFMTEDINLPDLKFTDKVAKPRQYSYRLRLTGKDGSSGFSKVIIVKGS